ncbi:MAG TPA: hypothetical protein PK771_05405 [Spirochaetota bacterium]|nr:hypothetical protein [Spirochaetota bacterium]
MIVHLTENIINLIRLKSFNVRVKVMEVSKNSTTIEIMGQRLSVPFVLDKNKKYIGILENETLKLLEKNKTHITEKSISKNESNDFLQQLLFPNDVENLKFTDILFNLFKNNQKSINKDNNFYFNCDEDNFIFLFNLDFFNYESKIYLKISKAKEIFLNILYDKNVSEQDITNFKNEIIENFKKQDRLIIINITNYKKEFLNLLDYKLNKIDIKI